MIRKFLRWFLFLAWTALVFFLSVQGAQGSGDLSLKVVEFLGKLANQMGLAPMAGFHAVVRDGAHFALHAVLAFLSYRAFACVARSPRAVVSATFIITTLVAVVDEVAQYLAPGRAFEVADIGLNVFGVLTGLVLAIIMTATPKMAYTPTDPPA